MQVELKHFYHLGLGDNPKDYLSMGYIYSIDRVKNLNGTQFYHLKECPGKLFLGSLFEITKRCPYDK